MKFLYLKAAFFHSTLLAVCLVFIGFSCGQSRSQSPSKPPNIIFVMADDHARRTIGAYGSEINQTPNIDRLAMEGAIFMNMFCANSICGPSRASILTGKHSHKNGVTGNAKPWDSTQAVFPGILREAGYQTALVGKWHLNSKPADEYDYYKILTGAGKQGFYYNPEFYTPWQGTDSMKGYSTNLITDEALNWLEHQRKSDKPFLLLVQYKAPHVPRMPPLDLLEKYLSDTIPEPPTLFDDLNSRSYYASQVNFFLNDYRPLPFYGTYDPDENIYLKRMAPEERQSYHAVIDPQNQQYLQYLEQGVLAGDAMRKYHYQRFIKDYLRMIDAVDQNVGRILDWLDGHENLKQNTVVVYTSDQGYFTGEHGYAEKRLMYEPAMSMPLLMRWPAIIEPGTVIHKLTQNIDFAPTFLDFANEPMPSDIQGKSLLPLLAGDQNVAWRKSVYYHYYDHGIHQVGRHHGVRTDRYKLIHYYTDDIWELYDLETDPWEIENIYGVEGHDHTTEMMQNELDKLLTEMEVPERVFSEPYNLE